MKTVTLWNVPVETAKVVVTMLREKAGEMLTQGAPISEVEKMLWNITSIEDEIKAMDPEEKDNG